MPRLRRLSKCYGCFGMSFGRLTEIKRWLKVVVFINCVDDFDDHPFVAAGFSEVINRAFGKEGVHARIGGRG